MPNLPKRVKNTEKVSASSEALRSNITTNPSSAQAVATKNFLETLELKVRLGLMTKEELQGLVPADSVEEKLTRKILRRLNRLGDHSAEFQLVARTYGTSDRLSLAASMSKRFADAAALRNVTQLALGENMATVNSFGQSEMDINMNNSAASADGPMGSGGAGSV